MSVNLNDNLSLALKYTALGWPVYPVWGVGPSGCLCGDPKCKRPGKHPWGRAVPNGQHDATSDPDQLRRFFPTPHVNVGIHVGPTNLFILDVEFEGLKLWEEWLRKYGPIPPTPTVRTGGGGLHIYFRRPANPPKSRRYYQCMDVRAESGAVIAPPSLHASGRRYEWLIDPETPLVDAPQWLLAELAADAGGKDDHETGAAGGGSPRPTLSPRDPMSGTFRAATFATLGDLPAQERNDPVCRVIGDMLSQGYTSEQIVSDGLAWAERQQPPYCADELERKVNSLAKKDGDQRGVWSVVSAAEEPEGEGDANEESTPATEDLSSFVVPASPAPTPPPVASRPTLHPDAYLGLVGDTLRAIEPQTEADPAGILFTLLVAFGNAAGTGPHVVLGSRRHATNQFAVLVGPTASRKGECWGLVRYLLAGEHEWLSRCVASSLGSGEGLVERVRDEQTVTEIDRKTGEPVQRVLPGAEDKRLLVVEEEFRKALTFCRRPDSTLGAYLLAAWDGSPMEVLNRVKNSLRATGHHVSLIGMTTPKELLGLLGTGTEGINGFSNRPLWCWVERSRTLPFGGDTRLLDQFRGAWQHAITLGRTRGQVGFDDSFRDLFTEVCPLLDADAEDDALTVRALERARPHVWRLSLLYALATGAGVLTADHLRAALAVWAYSAATCRRLFTAQGQADAGGGGGLADKLMTAIRRNATTGLSLTALHAVCGNRERAEVLRATLSDLERAGLVVFQPTATGGRRAERWFPAQTAVVSMEEVADLPTTGGVGGVPVILDGPSNEERSPAGSEDVSSFAVIETRGTPPPPVVDEDYIEGDENFLDELLAR